MLINIKYYNKNIFISNYNFHYYEIIITPIISYIQLQFNNNYFETNMYLQ